MEKAKYSIPAINEKTGEKLMLTLQYRATVLLSDGDLVFNVKASDLVDAIHSAIVDAMDDDGVNWEGEEE